MNKFAAVLFIVVMLAGCTSSPIKKIPHQEAYTYDQYTRFAIKEESDGFFLTVDYSRPMRFFDRSYKKDCISQFIAVARDLSDKSGRKIRPVNEESFNVYLGGEDYIACHAQAKVEWE